MDGLDKRADRVLDAVIAEFVRHGQPVGSNTLARRYRFNVSSATLRNVMAELTESGFLAQPHTSAGRVPTAKAFRRFVQRMGPVKGLQGSLIETLGRRFDEVGVGDLRDALRKASSVLSDLSSQLGFVVLPDLDEAVFQHIDLVRLGERRVLSVFVSRAGLVNTRLLHMDDDLSQDALDKMVRTLDELLEGLTLSEVKRRILDQMEQERALYDELYANALRLSEAALLSGGEEPELYVSGERNVVAHPEFGDVERMRALFDAFQRKGRLVDLLAQAASTDPPLVLIGRETQLADHDQLSLIAAPFGSTSSAPGALGLVGPLRMDYKSLIPLVQATADAVSDLFRR